MNASIAAVAFVPALALGAVLNALVLRGRGWSSAARIELRYPSVELGTGLLVAACFARFGVTGRSFVAGFFVSVLVVLSVIDAERRILPNRIVLPAATVVLAAQIALFPDRTLEWVLAALLASLALFLALIAYPPGMGMGDVKLALLLGAALGRSVADALTIGLVAAAVAGLFVIARGGRRSTMPLGPFLALGSVVALFLGDSFLFS